ncbi:inositol monophosphatase family protein [Sphingobium lignivorans]|uniref:Myo-inositol-1(Or 4)-monophosphatase n=1 Tax=Sphingobium lignivorans TaxID=2735886 RepID=A0ABR6NKJ3_9SPHN|nr:3'(2'),5'-bisphosphate nucleotidase CysQ [Sphingobium lignivorans]MBB5987172.1 myo-inositol-1(or 4)-monophosphatase [Sphingobium lignivorans]
MPANNRLLPDLLAIADEAAARAMLDWAPGEPSRKAWEKVPGEPVCEADLAVDALLRARLGALLPDAAWLSEESAETPGRSDAPLAWVVDPIDGTRDFVRGRTGWAISIALVEAGDVQLGVLAAPARQERWWAARGAGAFRNGARLAVGAQATLAGARVPLDTMRGVDMDYRMVPKPNGIALRMAMVAGNEADLVAGLRLSGEWDIAAATLIAQEAGAIVTDALGDPIRFNKPDPRVPGLLCGVPAIHEAGLARLRERALKMRGAG